LVKVTSKTVIYKTFFYYFLYLLFQFSQLLDLRVFRSAHNLAQPPNKNHAAALLAVFAGKTPSQAPQENIRRKTSSELIFAALGFYYC
jgi:hypothetical protein